MHYSGFDAEQERFGSARFAEGHEIVRAGLLGKDGAPVGFFGGKMMRLNGDAPRLTVAGAGSGKLRDQLAFNLCAPFSDPMMILDPKGELGAISMAVLAMGGIYGYFWNPFEIAGLPSHRCNPLDILDLNSRYFHADVDFIIAGLMPLTGSKNGKYFEQTAREWTSAIVKSDVEQNGRTSLPRLYDILCMVDSDIDGWSAFLEQMQNSRFPDVRKAAGEIIAKQVVDNPTEFNGVMGEISLYTSFLKDPLLRQSLEDGFSLNVLVDRSLNRGHTARVYLNVPGSYISLLSPAIRIFFTVAMLYKERRPDAARVQLIVDEAAQLGNFEALKRAFVYGRGAGIQAHALFQDVGQIRENFGPPGIQTLMGSAQCRQFFGVRDYETAKLISDMLGSQTLEYDDTLRQEQAERQRYNAARHVLMGGDPFEVAYDHAHYERESRHRTRQHRLLRSPAEILNTPENQQYLFISGLGLPPIRGEKHAYYLRRDMAGRYLANPQHPPTDSVMIKTRFGSKRVAIRSGAVPEKYALFPQYQNGTALWVDGYPL